MMSAQEKLVHQVTDSCEYINSGIGIGSEFWYGIDADRYQKTTRLSRQWGNARFFLSGRSAIKFAIKNLGVKENSTVLVPAYTCASTLQPFLEMGVNVDFFGVSDCFEPVFSSSNLAKAEKYLAILIVDYFGRRYDFHQFPEEFSDLDIIWDTTHSVFTQFEYNTAPASLFFEVASLRKWLATPVGGVLFNHKNMSIDQDCHYRSESSSQISAYREQAYKYRRRYIDTKQLRYKIKAQLFFKLAEEILDSDPIDTWQEPGHAFKFSLPNRLLFLKRKRRENFQVLHRAVDPSVHLPFSDQINSDKAICPIGFPIKHHERDKLRTFLISNLIYPPIHWSLPSELIPNKFEREHEMSSQILTIPCDQRYDKNDMLYIAKVINSFIKSH